MGNDASKNAVAIQQLAKCEQPYPPSIKVPASLSLQTGFQADRCSSARSSISRKSDVGLDRSRSNSHSSGRSGGLRHPLSIKNRQLIQTCFQNPHEALGSRIIKRAIEKRNEFAKFFRTLTEDHREEVQEMLKVLLKKTVVNIDFTDEVQRLAEETGERFVPYRGNGFRPDFFAAIADATICECVLLDNAVHPQHQTLAAFTPFIGMVFSSVRDGFYHEMRRNRRASNSFSTGSAGSYQRKRGSMDSNSQRSASPRSISPGDESINDEFFTGLVINTEDDGLLKPPMRLVSARSY